MRGTTQDEWKLSSGTEASASIKSFKACAGGANSITPLSPHRDVCAKPSCGVASAGSSYADIQIAAASRSGSTLIQSSFVMQDDDGKAIELVVQGATASFGGTIGSMTCEGIAEGACNVTGIC